jgi:hypothetical protein
MGKRTWVAAWVVALAVAIPAVAADDRVMQPYVLYTPEVATMVSLVESVVSPGSKVLYDKSGGRLLVLAMPEDHARVQEMLKDINQPLANIRIEVSTEEAGQEQLDQIGVSGSGEVVVDSDGARVEGQVTPRADSRRNRRQKDTRQSVLLQSGGEAVLRVGEEVPFAEWLVGYGHNQGYAVQAVETREVGAVLRVQARVIGNGPLISLKLTPEITGMTDGRPGTIQYTRLSTDVTVEDGQTLSLGGLTEHSEFFERFLVGVDREGRRRTLTLTVTPHIERPTAPNP